MIKLSSEFGLLGTENVGLPFIIVAPFKLWGHVDIIADTPLQPAG